MNSSEVRIVSAVREIDAAPAEVFELIAEPCRHPDWDGNENLSTANPGQRVMAVGDVFAVGLIGGAVRENHVVEFAEGRVIAWKPAEPGQEPVGHLWRWELEQIDGDRTRVVHTYDWTDLHDRARYERARSTTSDRLGASIDRLDELVRSEPRRQE